MRSTFTLLLAMLAMLLVTACSKEQSPPRQTAKPAATEPQSPAEEVRQVANEAEQKVEKTANEVKQEAEQEAKTAEKEAATAAEEAKTAVAETAEKAKQEAASAMDAMKPESAPPAARPPEVVSYEASMGTVTFNHANHAGRLDCSKCHTTDPPQKIAINKEVAHALCRGCHQQSGGKAPTACTGCHKK